MMRATTSPLALASKTEMNAAVEEASEAVGESFEQFCLIAELSSLTQMLDEDAHTLAGAPHAPVNDDLKVTRVWWDRRLESDPPRLPA